MPYRTSLVLAAVLNAAAPADGRGHIVRIPSSPMPTGTGLIVGQVVDAATSKGVAACVTLGNRRVLTTSDGRFVFRNLAEGSHTLTAAKAGYLNGAFGAQRPGGPSLPITLAAAERRGDIVVQLWRQGSMTGSVIDEAGEPLIGIQVTAMRRSIVGGRRHFTLVGTDNTDDRGVFRFPSLVPGDYLLAMATSQVSVPATTAQRYQDSMLSGIDLAPSALAQETFQISGPPVMTRNLASRHVGDQIQDMMRNAPTPPPTDGSRLFAYPTVFYPASPSAHGASVVSVASGQERSGLDLQVRPVPTSRVSGTVGGSAGPGANLQVRLIQAGSEELARAIDAAGTITDAKGAFTFLTVPAGDYTLRIVQLPGPTPPPRVTTTISEAVGRIMIPDDASSEVPPIPAGPTLWATVPVSIADADVTGATVALKTGLRITGRVEFDGTAGKPTADQLSSIPVMIEPIDGQLDRDVTPPGRIDARGQFNTYGFPAGRYLVRVGSAPKAWTFKGAFLGGRDVSDVPIELDTADVSDVIITFTDRPASLSGTVQMSQGTSRVVSVIVFPADSKSWMDTGLNPRRMRKVAPTDTGSYHVGVLPPGDYFVAAVAEQAAADWQDPTFLAALARRATQVRIGDGEKATQSLRVQEVR